jgi:fructose-1,6-bisphosphatase
MQQIVAMTDITLRQVDIRADEFIFERLQESNAVATASSEERPEEIPLGGQGFAVNIVAQHHT